MGRRDQDRAERTDLLWADAQALQRIARVLLQQIKRGGPSNFEQVAGHYLDAEDAEVFRWVVLQPGGLPGTDR